MEWQMSIRVLRLLEYTYDSVESMQRDMQQWKIQGGLKTGPRVSIRSVTLPLEVLADTPPVAEKTASPLANAALRTPVPLGRCGDKSGCAGPDSTGLQFAHPKYSCVSPNDWKEESNVR
jgi:hypothetical protein